ILHAGRYGYHPLNVAPSKIKAPISPFTPSKLSERQIKLTIKDFVNCAKLAQNSGYDGVEVMGSEGYLINQFIVARTNNRTDKWGMSYENRIRFPVEIVRGIREALGDKFIIMYRLSMLDLVDNGSTWEEIVILAKAIEAAGASIVNTGIGWHEARIPTIASNVPHGAFTWITAKLKKEINLPCVTSNRINSPMQAEEILKSGQADFISMARPFLADPNFVLKAEQHRTDEINTCIGCNQACLDNVFKRKRATCMVNPYACFEEEYKIETTSSVKNIAVVGAGPGGLACAMTLAQRGHTVTLFDQHDKTGGQFNLAKRIPGKSDFQSTIDYFTHQLELLNVKIQLNTKVTIEDLQNFDEVILATGVKPRIPDIPGIEHDKVSSYVDVISGKVQVGNTVAIIGAGGIGFDCAEYLLDNDHAFFEEWGIDLSLKRRGGLAQENIVLPKRNIYLLQRKSGKVGKGLGKTTGWIHRATMKKYGVQMLSNVSYEKINDAGLYIRLGDSKPQLLTVTNIIICAGQEPLQDLLQPLIDLKIKCHLIGGADIAAELDAVRAIKQGTLLGLDI
ncbi:MAG: FAD-dependent oxidoreductase, partial [Francisellaceae bacterium]|nr:FAD-dependent oxidoreductase [Francisellaceae bacterium]